MFDVGAFDVLADALRPETTETALASFISRGAALPFRWGICDCALWACDWVLERRGVDPLAGRRGTYHSEGGAANILAAAGGIERLMARACAAADLEPGPAETGAIGIVGTLLGPAVMIALAPDLWIGKAPRGIRTVRANPAKVWIV